MTWLVELFLANGEQIAMVLGIITAAAAAVGVLWKWIFQPIYAFAKKAWSCIGRLDGALATLDEIAYQFRPNSGSSLRDVIDRLETYVAVSNTKIHSIMNYHKIAAWESDSSGACIWASDELQELIGLHWEQMEGFGWLTGIGTTTEEREAVNREWAAAVTAQREFYMEYHVNTVNPTLVVGRAIQVRDTKGQVKGFVGTLQPIRPGEPTAPPGPGLPSAV